MRRRKRGFLHRDCPVGWGKGRGHHLRQLRERRRSGQGGSHSGFGRWSARRCANRSRGGCSSGLTAGRPQDNRLSEEADNKTLAPRRLPTGRQDLLPNRCVDTNPKGGDHITANNWIQNPTPELSQRPCTLVASGIMSVCAHGERGVAGTRLAQLERAVDRTEPNHLPRPRACPYGRRSGGARYLPPLAFVQIGGQRISKDRQFEAGGGRSSGIRYWSPPSPGSRRGRRGPGAWK